jgi:hypothetical protein
MNTAISKILGEVSNDDIAAIDLETQSTIGTQYALSITKVVLKYAKQNAVKNCKDILMEALDF